MIEKLVKLLQTKVASLGYNKKELRGIAQALSNNSKLTEDATDEAIAREIEAIVPYLRFGQQQANRIAASAGKPHANQRGDADAPAATPRKTSHPTSEMTALTQEPAWAQRLEQQLQQLGDRLEAIEQERAAHSQLERIRQLLLESGTRGG